MKKEPLPTKYQAGFSLVEVILATSVFVLLVTTFVGSYLYGQESTLLAGNRAQAVYLAEEGLEAVRNIRDAGYANLVDGSYGLTNTSNQWNLSGANDETGIFTRQVVVSTVDVKRKLITANVLWQQNPQRTGSVSLVTRLTNWIASGQFDWSTCVQGTTLDLSGSQDGFKIQVQGDFAYLVRSDGTPDFVVVNISNPTSPTITGSLSLTGEPTNIAVSGNYAYVSSTDNSQELQIIDISTPSAPNVVGTYNGAGNANANGIFVSGTTVYIVRASSANNELLIVNVGTPSSPSLVGSLNLGDDGNEVFVRGNYAYVASNSNSQELQIVNISTPSSPSVAGSLNISGNENSTTVTGFETTIALGRTDGFLYLIDVSAPATPTVLGSYDTSGRVNDVALGSDNTYVFIANSAQTAEFQVVDISTPTTPTSVCSSDLAGQVDLNGVSYSETYNHAFGAASANSQELVIISP